MSLSVDESPLAEQKRRLCRRRVVIWFVLLAILAGSLAVRFAMRASEVESGWIASALIFAVTFLLLRSGWHGVQDVRDAETFPARHWEDVSGSLTFAIGLCGSMVLVSPLIGPAFLPVDETLTIGEMAGVILAIDYILSIVNSIIRDCFHHVSVLPYFRSQVGDIHTFSKGHHVARHLGELDELARSIEVAPLSTFGWNDDRRGEPLVWHDSAEGLRTVKGLMAALEKEDFARADHSGIIEDLKRIAHALDRAQVQGIAFCLLLRHGDTTNAMEHEQRKGSFF